MARPPDVAGWKRQWRRIHERVVESNSACPLERVTSTAEGSPWAETAMRTPTLPVIRRRRRDSGYGGRGECTMYDVRCTILEVLASVFSAIRRDESARRDEFLSCRDGRAVMVRSESSGGEGSKLQAMGWRACGVGGMYPSPPRLRRGKQFTIDDIESSGVDAAGVSGGFPLARAGASAAMEKSGACAAARGEA